MRSKKVLCLLLLGVAVCLLISCYTAPPPALRAPDFALYEEAVWDALNQIPESVFKRDGYVLLFNMRSVPLGKGDYDTLTDVDLAVENGFVNAVLQKGGKVCEKVGNLPLKTAESYSNKVFYTNPLVVDSLKGKRFSKVSDLLCFRILKHGIDKKNVFAHVEVYIRVVDLSDENYQILYSDVIAGVSKGKRWLADHKTHVEIEPSQARTLHDHFKRAVGKLPEKRLKNISNAVVVNTEELSLGKPYRTKKPIDLAIEEGIISGIASRRRCLKEKFTPLDLKKPWMLDQMMFNVSPLLFSSWKDFAEENGVDQVLEYSVVFPHYVPTPAQIEEDEKLRIHRVAVLLKTIDANKDGQVLWADFLRDSTSEEKKKDEDVTKHIQREQGLFEAARTMGKGNSFSLKAGQNVLLFNVDYIPIGAKTRPTRSDLLFEDGFSAGLREQGLNVCGKIASFYRKQNWMYSNQVLYLNPIYFKNWEDITKQNIRYALTYQLLPQPPVPVGEERSAGTRPASGGGSKKASPLDDSKAYVTASVRIVDTNTGELLSSKSLRNYQEFITAKQ